jgi:hypothetical protein
MAGNIFFPDYLGIKFFPTLPVFCTMFKKKEMRKTKGKKFSKKVGKQSKKVSKKQSKKVSKKQSKKQIKKRKKNVRKSSRKESEELPQKVSWVEKMDYAEKQGDRLSQMPNGPKKAAFLHQTLRKMQSLEGSSSSFISLESFFGIDKKVKTIQWDKWSRAMTTIDKNIIHNMRQVAKIMAEYGCYVHIVIQPLPNDSGVIWGDFGSTDLVDIYGYGILEIPYLIFELRLADGSFKPIYNETCMKHGEFTTELFQVLQVPETKWDGDQKKRICFKG